MRLGKVLADYRWANRIGVRELAKTIGVSHGTLCRLELNKNCDAATLTKILMWLFSNDLTTKRQRP